MGTKRTGPQGVGAPHGLYKFVRLGITEERFIELLEAQGYACAMCHEPFGDAFPHADHDCCEKQDKATAKTCSKCIRGLLCFRCNTALGYIEKYGDLAKAYLDQVAARVGDAGFEPATPAV